jgi:tetratricopeptide (TPR) repeat protein
MKVVFCCCLLLSFLVLAFGQNSQAPREPAPGQTASSSERNQEAGESSSRDTKVDLSPPKDDAKNHPDSRIPDEADSGTSDVQEFHPWDPHKAMKDIEVGEYYYKRKNYKAALDRFHEALYYKNNDAEATFRLAQCQEKLDEPADSLSNYQAYLKILPHGPYSEEARKAIDRLKVKGVTANAPSGEKTSPQ